MNIFQLNNLPDDIMPGIGWGIRGPKLLFDNQLHTSDSFVLINIQNEADVNTAVDYCVKCNFQNLTLYPSVFSETSGFPFYQKSYDPVDCLSDPSQIRAGILSCIEVLKAEDERSKPCFFSSVLDAKACVMVQQKIDADICGVCFTEDPEGDRVILIQTDASEPDAAASSTFRVLENDHRFYIENPAEDAFLNNMILTAIAPQARQVGASVGCPLKLSWIIADSQLFWLEAIPVTSDIWQNPSEFDTSAEYENHTFSTSIINNILPGPVTPLTLSTVVKALDQSVRHSLVSHKLARQITDLPESAGVACFNSHAFLNVTQINQIAGKQMDGFKELIDVSLCGEVLGESYSRCWDLTLSDFILQTGRYFKSFSIGKDTEQKIQSLCDSMQKISKGASLREQIETINQKLNALDTAFSDFFSISAAVSFMSTALYLIFIKALLSPEKAKTLMLKCLSDIHDVESLDIVTSLTTVARELVLDNPQVANYSFDEIKNALLQAESESKKAFDAFNKHHGHRGFFEMELRNLPWHHRQEDLVRYVYSILTTNLSEVGQSVRVPQYLGSLEEKFDVRTVALIKPLIDQARNAVMISDSVQSKLVQLLGWFKDAYRQLSKKMAQEELIPNGDLIYFMTHAELLEYIPSNNGDAKDCAYHGDLIKKALMRNRVYEAQKKHRFGMLHAGRPLPLNADLYAPKKSMLKGRCSTPGVSQGTARVICGLQDLEQLKPGEIIVTAISDIGFTPYFNMAAGLITESGTEFSQAAIVARELALPHVTGLKFATRFIKTDDSISINAASGEVTLLKK